MSASAVADLKKGLKPGVVALQGKRAGSVSWWIAWPLGHARLALRNTPRQLVIKNTDAPWRAVKPPRKARTFTFTMSKTLRWAI